DAKKTINFEVVCVCEDRDEITCFLMHIVQKMTEHITIIGTNIITLFFASIHHTFEEEEEEDLSLPIITKQSSLIRSSIITVCIRTTRLLIATINWSLLSKNNDKPRPLFIIETTVNSNTIILG
ncbi:hypothetical protein ACJX0J_009292, partial [Zea mays]